MRIWITLFAGALALALGARAGVAQEGRHGPPGPGHFFERLDANQDGNIALDEIPEGAPVFFAKFDKNEDGKIDREEAVGPMKEKFDEIDSDKDGAIDREEGRQAMVAAMKMGFMGRGSRGFAMGRTPARPPAFGRGAGFGPGGDGFKPRDGFGWQMGRGMHGPGGPKFDRSMAHDHGRPMMWHRGPGRGLEMGRGMQGPGGPKFNRSMAHNHGGPMMWHRGPGRGPEMGRGMQGPGGPKFDRSMAHNHGGPMMSHRGPGRDPETGHDKAGREDHELGLPVHHRGPRMKQVTHQSAGGGFGPTGKSRGPQAIRGPHNLPGEGERPIISPQKPDKTTKARHEKEGEKPVRPERPDGK